MTQLLRRQANRDDPRGQSMCSGPGERTGRPSISCASEDHGPAEEKGGPGRHPFSFVLLQLNFRAPQCLPELFFLNVLAQFCFVGLNLCFSTHEIVHFFFFFALGGVGFCALLPS